MYRLLFLNNFSYVKMSIKILRRHWLSLEFDLHYFGNICSVRKAVLEKIIYFKMVKFTVLNNRKNSENVKCTRELNTYGFDGNGIGEELLFPIRLNEPSGGNQETNLATYLVKFMEFEKTCVKIKKNTDKGGFKFRSL